MKIQTHELELIKEFVVDYQVMSIEELFEKYKDFKYDWAITDEKVFHYMKENNLLQLLIEKDPSSKSYLSLVQKVDGYKLYTGRGNEESFKTIEEAAFSKLKHLIRYFGSSLIRK